MNYNDTFYNFGNLTMKNTLYITIIVFTFALLLTSCEDSGSASDEATILHISTIQNQVGYTWFFEEANTYEPIPDVITQIKEIFNPDLHIFLIFSQPSCSCESKQLAFPHFMKVLIDAEIPESNYTIYSLQTEMTKHPHEDIINITDLPEFYILKENIVIMDVQKAMSEFISLHPDDSITYEELILEALNL